MQSNHNNGHEKEEFIPLVESKLNVSFHSTSSSLGEDDARKILMARPKGVVRDAAAAGYDQEIVEKAHIQGSRFIVFPWMSSYTAWWSLTAAAAIFTVFLNPFEIAFGKEHGTLNDSAGAVDFGLTLIFVVDIVMNFNLAFYKNGIIVFDRKEIFIEYFRFMFWVDFVGVFPFETAALLISGEFGNQSKEVLLYSLLRLLRFVRLHRLKRLDYILQYDARISLIWYTLIRNIGVTMALTHVEACFMYFLARLNHFDEDTWLGPLVENMTVFERYTTSLYWAIVTFCTVGYGDFAPSNSIEQVFGTIFMLVNIVVAAWIIGSITLLIVKGDEKTGEYRDSLETLHQYGEMNQFDKQFMSKLKSQLRLEFNNREIADEQVLTNFPSAVRRKILRKLYLQPLIKSKLMTGVRPQFVDAFLASCKVEIFNPGEQLIERGSILSDLFLLVGGMAEIETLESAFADSSRHGDGSSHKQLNKLEAGDFIGEIGFFTESPQTDTISCLTVCKTLTISRSTYKLLAEDHPGSVGKILQNLLGKVEEMDLQLRLPRSLPMLRAGSMFDVEAGYGSTTDALSNSAHEEDIRRQQDALTAVKDLVKMHMSKQLDDQTTKLLFAASRGDTGTISLMCDQGFDPNNADYDSRTALMVASMKGNVDVVKILLHYEADPNLTDMHGSTALLEAVKNGHEDTMKLLFEYGGKLCMEESLAASVLCQAVYDGDTTLLKRLLKAKIQVDASDYDKRTAAHIAAAEGNVAAIRILAEHGADLTLPDRWNNTVQHEAKRSNATKLLEYLASKSGK